MSFARTNWKKISSHLPKLEPFCQTWLKLALQVNSDTACIVKWSGNLKVTPQAYLDQLQIAIEGSTGDGSNESDSTAVGVTKQHKSTSSFNDVTEHIFEIVKGALSWKQYFPDKKIYGKRGNIQLTEVRKYIISY